MILQYSIRFNIDMDIIGSQLLEEEAFKAGKYQRSMISPMEMITVSQKQALLQQRLEGMEVQLTLLNQLLESKNSENKTLKLQIELLHPAG